MKVGIILYSGDSEVVWNAFRFGNFVLAMGDESRIFLIGEGVACAEYESLDTEKFKVTEQLETFVSTGGKISACGTCLEIHQLKAPDTFTVASLRDMYEIVKESDKIITL